jgi:hypothetical protein
MKLPYLTVTTGWPDVWHQTLFLFSPKEPTTRTVVRYEPSKAVTGPFAGVALGPDGPGDTAHALTIGIRARARSLLVDPQHPNSHSRRRLGWCGLVMLALAMCIPYVLFAAVFNPRDGTFAEPPGPPRYSGLGSSVRSDARRARAAA